jgi:methyl-accepting chemotaxis protein
MTISLIKKLAFLSIISAFPSSFLLYKVHAVRTESISFSEMEMLGNTMQRSLEKILHAAIRIRIARIQGLKSEAAERDMEQNLKELLEIEKQVGNSLQFTQEGLGKRNRQGKNAENLRAQWQSLQKADGDQWSEFIRDLRTMITHAGDTSNLILDPDLDSYYLMDITLLALPQTQDDLQQLAYWLEGMFRKESWGLDERISLAVQIDRLQTAGLDRINASGATSINEDPNFYGVSPGLKESFGQALAVHDEAMKKLIESLKNLEKNGTSAQGLTEFRSNFEATIKQNFALWEVAAGELDKLLTTRIDTIKQERSLSLAIGSLVVAGTIVIALLLGLNVSRQLKRVTDEMKKSGKGLGDIGTDLNGASDDLSSAAQNIASSLEETAASLEELSAVENDNLHSADKAATISQKCLDGARKAEAEMQKLMSAMHSISESSKRIEEVVVVIEGIAFQTNLLALNAAVEAARAGEQGKGFSVVAEAVRGLAQKSSMSAKDISRMIKDSSTSVKAGGLLAQSSSDILGQLVADINQIAAANDEISNASREQATRLNMIKEAVNQIDQSTQSNAATALQSARASEGVNSQVGNLNSMVEKLELIVEGSKSA